MRQELRASLLPRAREGPPLLVTGPPGAGKTTLFLGLAVELTRDGCVPVYLDLFAAASSPERFVNAALRALPVESFGARLPQALEIRRLAAAGRARGADAVHALLRLLASLDEAQGRRVVLLLDEVTEIRSLAYFAGLRDVARPFEQALVARRRGTFLATSFPTQAAKLWGFERMDLPPLQAAHLSPFLGANAADEILRASFGWARSARILLEALRAGGGVASAWAREMSPGGRLETNCRATYESLLLRSRGYGISKALLAMIAHSEGRNLTAIYREIGRSPGATRDYLGWLLDVDAVKMVGKRYYYVDGLVRQWVRLYGRGRLPTAREIEAAATELLAAPPTPEDEALTETAPRRETLMEID